MLSFARSREPFAAIHAGEVAAPARPAGRSAIAAVADPLWFRLRAEAEPLLRAEPALTSLIWSAVLARATIDDVVVHRMAARLASPVLPVDALADMLGEVVAAAPSLSDAIRRDIQAVLDRDPATDRVLDVVLYFKGFLALQTQRFAHRLWSDNRRDAALFLQSRSSEVFGVDIHPAARLGGGLFLDHATGFSAGETTVIEDDVSILQGVTLGGSGSARGDRHPKIRQGSLIGAGAQVIGPVEIGHGSRVAAGSVVLEDVPPCTTVAGVPARIVGAAGCFRPASVMDQGLGEAAYEAFNYTV